MTTEHLGRVDDVLGQAIEWAMVASEGFSDDAQRRAFDTWLTQDARHREIWRKLSRDQAALRTLGGSITGTTIAAAFETPRADRRAVLRAMGGVGLSLGGLVLVVGFDIPLALAADMHTRTGERRRYDLVDGTALTLDACTRVDRAFGPGQRGIVLNEGAVFVQVLTSVAPFSVRAGRALVAIASGEFMIWKRSGECQIICMTGTGNVSLGAESRRIDRAGQGYAVSEASLVPLVSAVTMDATAWLDGKLILHDRSLADLIGSFRPYERGLLSISEAAGALRVSGIFDLDDLGGTLTMVQAMHPLRVLRLGDLLCHISMLD